VPYSEKFTDVSEDRTASTFKSNQSNELATGKQQEKIEDLGRPHTGMRQDM
jgi:hypothetical protein